MGRQGVHYCCIISVKKNIARLCKILAATDGRVIKAGDFSLPRQMFGKHLGKFAYVELANESPADPPASTYLKRYSPSCEPPAKGRAGRFFRRAARPV